MGACGSTDNAPTKQKFKRLIKPCESWNELARALGPIETSDLIFAIDHSKSNETNGRMTFGGKNLHHFVHITDEATFNPYQQVISCLYDTLVKRLDADGNIPVYGFACSTTVDKQVFSYNQYKPCKDKRDVLHRYACAVTLPMSGPTTFAPVIYEAIGIVKTTGKYHILIIICDGAVDDQHIAATHQAIVEASNYPLSIICIGVGDGPWDKMYEMDDKIPNRKLDNFQFVEFKFPMDKNDMNVIDDFKFKALGEIPEQHEYFRTSNQRGLFFKTESDSFKYRNNDFIVNGEGQVASTPYIPPAARAGAS
jgi:hypothetical protein